MGLIEEINRKEIELANLQSQYEEQQEQAKAKVLKNKNAQPMGKTKYLLGFEFESSSALTKQCSEFYRVFKKEFTALLKPFISEIKFSKGHFEISGFLKTLKGEIYYFSLGDLRISKNYMLYRTAKSFEDYTGGSNQYLSMGRIENIPNFIW